MFIEVDKEVIDTDDDNIVKIRQKLFPEEEKMPLAKYFYKYPLHMPTPVEMQIIQKPMDVRFGIMRIILITIM